MTGAVFLDRDGTINKKAPYGQYILNKEQFEFLPGVLDALRFLHKNSERRIVIVTNQAAIGRGFTLRCEVNDLHAWVSQQVRQAGGLIHAFYICPHTIDDKCRCRKPQPGLLVQASREMELDLARSVMVGDTMTDIQAGWRAGVGECYLSTGGLSIVDWPDSWRGRRYKVVGGLWEVAQLIVEGRSVT